MRLDKFLKWSRLVKRRTVANELATGGHVMLNGRSAKPSAEIKPGDQLQLRFGNRCLLVEILLVPERAPAVQAAGTLYRVLSETVVEASL